MNSLSFSAPNFVNSEPIEQNLNGLFANKYGKIQSWLRNYNKLWEIKSQFFTNLLIYNYVLSKLKIFGGYSDLTCSLNDE